jgi:hypothetical protein
LLASELTRRGHIVASITDQRYDRFDEVLAAAGANPRLIAADDMEFLRGAALFSVTASAPQKYFTKMSDTATGVRSMRPVAALE